MFCRKCGNELKPGEKFCAKCGTAVSVDSRGTEQSRTENSAGAEQSRIENSAGVGQSRAGNSKETEQSQAGNTEQTETARALDARQEKSSGGKGLSVVIAVLAVMICAAAFGIGATVRYMNSDGGGSRKDAASGTQQDAETQADADAQTETQQAGADTQADVRQQADADTQTDIQRQTDADTQADGAQAAQGSGGPQTDQQKAEIQKALAAYEACVDEQLQYFFAEEIGQADRGQWKEKLKYSMMYIDEDEIPECYICGGNTFCSMLLRYQNGKALRYDLGHIKFWYQKRKNRIAVDNNTSADFQRYCYELEDRDNGLREQWKYTHGGTARPDDVYMIGDSVKEIGEEEWYDDCFSSSGIFLEVSETEPSLQKAYGALLEAEEETDAVNDRFGVISGRKEDYENSMLQNMYSGAYYFYDSGIGDFAFSYPHQLFCDVQYKEDKTKNAYGTNVQDIDFTGSGGSELRFTLTKRDGKEPLDQLADRIYERETGTITDAVKLRQDTERDYSRFVVTGYNSGRSKVIYEVVKLDADYVMQMVFTCPQASGEADRQYKGYVTECLYRLCRFSKNDAWVRRFDDYAKAQQAAR